MAAVGNYNNLFNDHSIKFEVCVDSIASAVNAAEGGAQRIELCSALSEGGLTPSLGVLKVLKALPLNIPIFCMLRPRRGNDFVYTQLELDAILADIEQFLAFGADGFVFGALTEQRTIDVEKCEQVIRKSCGVPVTFHRAFDLTNPALMQNTVMQIKELGFKRILSSGFKQSAAEGIEYLAQLIGMNHRDVIVMPGAGITVGNLEEILTVTKCTEFHASAKAAAGEGGFGVIVGGGATRMECECSVDKQNLEQYEKTDADVVRKMVTIAKSMAMS